MTDDEGRVSSVYKKHEEQHVGRTFSLSFSKFVEYMLSEDPFSPTTARKRRDQRDRRGRQLRRGWLLIC